MELTGDWLLDYFLIKKKGKQTEPDGFVGLSREDTLWPENI